MIDWLLILYILLKSILLPYIMLKCKVKYYNAIIIKYNTYTIYIYTIYIYTIYVLYIYIYIYPIYILYIYILYIYILYILYIYIYTIYSTTILLQVHVAARPGRTSTVSSSSAHSQLCPLTTPDASEMKQPAKNPTAHRKKLGKIGKTLLKKVVFSYLVLHS